MYIQVYKSIIQEYTQVCPGIHKYTQAYRGIHKYTRVYTSIHGYTQVYTNIHRYTHVHTGIHNCIYTCILAYTHCKKSQKIGTQLGIEPRTF